MARLSREIKNTTKNTLGLGMDILGLGLQLVGGTVSTAKTLVDNTSVENVKNTFTYTADVLVGNEIGTANERIAKAQAEGNWGVVVAEFALDTIHGKKAYREAVRAIEEKISVAEDELDALLAENDLLELEIAAKKEIAKLTAKAEQNKIDA